MYSLDYSIERDTDRVAAVYDILDTLERDPPPSELERMGTYILCGKDENGLNAAQRGEITMGNTRYNSFRRKDDKLMSLDALLENPLTDQQHLEPLKRRDPYIKKRTVIARPRLDKRTGDVLDLGDADIPGMPELWERIDWLNRWIQVLEGKIEPNEDDLLFENSYRLYQLRHMLIDLRRHQYYLKDAYKPVIHFLSIQHPKTQYINWTEDAYYWMPLDKWRERTQNALLHSISKDLRDYETRETENGIEVKWVVQPHTFDWENPKHVRAFINCYESLRDYVWDKLDTYSKMLMFDFDRYREMAALSPVREFLLDWKLARVPYPQILEELQIRFGLHYNENHLSEILAREIPQKIADAVKRDRIIADTPDDQKKRCFHCGKLLPRTSLFFSRNRTRRDGFASSCKECEKAMRIERGGQGRYDRRSKESALHEM